MRRLIEARAPFGILAAFCFIAACSDRPEVPADEMNADELARAIEKVASVKETKAAAQPQKRAFTLEPLRSGDVDPGFANAAICSFTSAAGVMMMATRDRLVARVGERPVTFKASGPVAPDGAYFVGADARISIGLGEGARRLPQISAGGAEARISLPQQPRFSTRGTWACKPKRELG